MLPALAISAMAQDVATPSASAAAATATSATDATSARKPLTTAKADATATKTPAKSATPESLTVANKRYDATKELERMTKRYSLTADQRAKIQPILLEQQRQIHTFGEDTSLTDAEWNSAVHKVHGNTVAQIKLQLTDEQALKYANDEAKFAKSQGNTSDDDDHGPPDGGPPPGGPPPGGPPPGM